jgi:hypothetical protein
MYITYVFISTEVNQQGCKCADSPLPGTQVKNVPVIYRQHHTVWWTVQRQILHFHYFRSVQLETGIAQTVKRIGWGFEGQGFESRQGQTFLSSPKRLECLWGPSSHIKLNWNRGYFTVVKWPGCEADRSPHSSTEVKNEWSYAPNPAPYSSWRGEGELYLSPILVSAGRVDLPSVSTITFMIWRWENSTSWETHSVTGRAR